MADIELGSIEIKTGANTSDKFKLPYNVLADPPDLSVYAKLAGGNTFTGKQTLNSPATDGYSIQAAGYIKGSWLQASAPSNKGSNTGKVCVFDNAGWIYYRTPAEILSEAGGAKASDIPDISGKANLSGGNTFTGDQTIADSQIVLLGYGDRENRYLLDCYDEAGSSDTLFGIYMLGADFAEVRFGDASTKTRVMLRENYGTDGQVFTSRGANATPEWTTPAIKSATLSGTTLYLTL